MSRSFLDKPSVEGMLSQAHSELRSAINLERQENGLFSNLPLVLGDSVRMSSLCGEPLLTVAIRHRNVGLVRDLLACGADVNQLSRDESITPMSELNRQLAYDFAHGEIIGIHTALIAKAVASQEKTKNFIPYYTAALIATPLLFGAFMLTGQYNDLQYYAAVAISMSRIFQRNMSWIVPAYRTLLYGSWHYLNHRSNEAIPENYDSKIIKPKTSAARHREQFYQTVRLGCYVSAYTALAFNSTILFCLYFTAAVGVSCVQKLEQLFALARECPARPRPSDGLFSAEHAAKYFNQKRKIDKASIQLLEQAGFTLLTFASLVFPMSLVVVTNLVVTAVLIAALSRILIGLSEWYAYRAYVDLQDCGLAAEACRNDSALDESSYNPMAAFTARTNTNWRVGVLALAEANLHWFVSTGRDMSQLIERFVQQHVMPHVPDLAYFTQVDPETAVDDQTVPSTPSAAP